MLHNTMITTNYNDALYLHRLLIIHQNNIIEANAFLLQFCSLLNKNRLWFFKKEKTVFA